MTARAVYRDPSGFTVHGRADLVEAFEGSVERRRLELEAWTAELEARGVVVAHPDDGWVNRDSNRVSFAYPQLLARLPRVGDLAALGGPEFYRLVVLVEFHPGLLGCPWWSFEPADPSQLRPLEGASWDQVALARWEASRLRRGLELIKGRLASLESSQAYLEDRLAELEGVTR